MSEVGKSAMSEMPMSPLTPRKSNLVDSPRETTSILHSKAETPQDALRILDGVITKLGSVPVSSGKENQSPIKYRQSSLKQTSQTSEVELYSLGCQCLKTLWGFEAKKLVKSSEIDRRHLLMVQKLVSGSENEIGFGLNEIVVVFKRLFRRIAVDHEVFTTELIQQQLGKLLFVDVPPKKTITAVVNIVVSLHLAMLKAFARSRLDDIIIEQLVASLKHPCGPVAWTGKTASTYKQAKLTTLSKLTAALSRKCHRNSLNAMKLQLVSMECASDMSQMDLLTDTVQKMTEDANISEDERAAVISDLLKYLGGLDTEVEVESSPAEETVAISLSLATALSGPFSLTTLLCAVKTTDMKQLGSQSTLNAIEKFFLTTHKSGAVSKDQILGLTALLKLLSGGTQNLTIKKLLPRLCDYSSAILKSSHGAIDAKHVSSCFEAVGDCLVELKETQKLILLSNLVFNLGSKPRDVTFLILSTNLHRSAGVSEQYLMKCSKLATLLCDQKQWEEAVEHCAAVISSLKDVTILSEDPVVTKFMKLLAYPLLNLDNQMYTFPKESHRPKVQTKLIQMLSRMISSSSRLKQGVLINLFKFQHKMLGEKEMHLDFARLLTASLSSGNSQLMDISIEALASLANSKAEDKMLKFYLLSLSMIYLPSQSNLDELSALMGTVKLDKDDSELVSLLLKYTSVQKLYSLELQLHKFGDDRLSQAQCHLNLNGDVQKAKALLKTALDSKDTLSHLRLLQLAATNLLLEGQFDAAQKRLSKHAQVVASDPVLSRELKQGKADSETPEEYCLRLTCQVRYWLIQARLFFEQSHLEYSVATVKKALSISQAYLKRFSTNSILQGLKKLPSYSWEICGLNLQAAIFTTATLLHLGLWREAEQVLTQSLTYHGSVGHLIQLCEAQSLLGWLHLKKGDLPASETSFTEACELREGDSLNDISRAILYIQVGTFHFKTGQMEESFTLFEQALQVLNSLNDSSELSRDISQLRVERRKKAVSVSSLPGLRRLFAQVERLKIELQIACEQPVSKHSSSTIGKWDTVMDQFLESRIALSTAKKLLSSDAIFMGLDESAVSFPSASISDISSHPNNNVQSAHGMLAGAQKTLTAACHELLESCSQIEINKTLHFMSKLDITVSALASSHQMSPWLDFRGVVVDKRRAVLSKVNIGEWNVAIEGTPTESHTDFKVKTLLSNLPEAWNVVSLAICPDSGDLIVSQYSAGNDPFLLRLPLHRHNSRDVDEQPFLFSDGLEELKSIISESDIMTRAGTTFPGGSEAWWAKRHELDGRLKQLLHDAEFCWFGGFLGVLSERNNLKGNTGFTRTFTHILNKNLPSRNGSGRRKRGFKPVSIDPRVLSLFLGMKAKQEDDIAPELLEDLVYFVLDILQFHGEYNAYDEIDTDQMFLEIEEAIGAHFAAENNRYNHTILVLDSLTTQFPWENIPSLFGRSVSRVPSLQVLGKLLDSCPEPSGSPFYILNPSGDLPKTQDRFQEVISPFSGLVGTPPTESDWLEALKTSSSLIYMGHGGGDKYVRNSSISKLDTCCPTVLLGCSSGVVRQAGELEPWGIPMAYMAAGCPSLVANLWDVTDKDIDKFGRQFLKRWGVLEGDEKTMDCCAAVAQSRNDCLLRYLNGAAPVVYGIPTFYNF